MMCRTIDADYLRQLLQEEFGEGRDFALRVTGWSMMPFLRHERDRVILQSPAQNPPGVYDVVLFSRDDGKLVLHRIIGRDDEGYVINGDAQTWTERIRPEQILAVAGGFVRGMRFFFADSRTYRVLTRLWVWLRPVRQPILRAGTVLASGWRKIRGGHRR